MERHAGRLVRLAPRRGRHPVPLRACALGRALRREPGPGVRRRGGGRGGVGRRAARLRLWQRRVRRPHRPLYADGVEGHERRGLREEAVRRRGRRRREVVPRLPVLAPGQHCGFLHGDGAEAEGGGRYGERGWGGWAWGVVGGAFGGCGVAAVGVLCAFLVYLV